MIISTILAAEGLAQLGCGLGAGIATIGAGLGIGFADEMIREQRVNGI